MKSGEQFGAFDLLNIKQGDKMSDVSNGTGGSSAAPAGDPQNVAGGSGSGNGTQSYNKEDALLADLARERKKRQELETKMQEIERQKLEAEGDKDKVITTLKKDLSDYKSRHANWMRTRVEDQVAVKAQELGCVDTELLLKAIDVDSVEVDGSTFKITNPDAVTSMIEMTRKSKPFLFKQSGPAVRDGVPGNQVATQVKNEKPLDKLKSTQEIIEFARKQGMTT